MPFIRFTRVGDRLADNFAALVADDISLRLRPRAKCDKCIDPMASGIYFALFNSTRARVRTKPYGCV